MSWIEAVLARPAQREPDQKLTPKLALSLLTSGEYWRFERASQESTHLPPRRDSQGHISEPSWALVFAFSLVNDSTLTEEGLNVLSEVVSSPEVREDPEMAAVANAFAARGLSRLNLFRQAISVIQAALDELAFHSLARLFLQQQLTIYLADADRYKEALHSARQARRFLNSWKHGNSDAYPPSQQEIWLGLSEAVESNIRLLTNVTSRHPKHDSTFSGEPNKYWMTRNTVLEVGFSTYVRDSFDDKLRVTLGRSSSRFSERESPRTALTTFLFESELAGYYRRVLVARSLLGKQQVVELDLADETRIRNCTHLIRYSRDTKSYEKFLKFLIAGGPLPTLAEEVLRAADSLGWPPRKEDFIALKVAGSLLHESVAGRALSVLIDMPTQEHVRDLNSAYLADAYIWPAIRSLIPVAGAHTEVSRKMREVASVAGAHAFSELVSTARVIDWSQVSEDEKTAWVSWIESDKSDDASLLEQEIAQALANVGNMGPLGRYYSKDTDLTITEVATLIDFGSGNTQFRVPSSVANRVSGSLKSELDELMLDASRGSYSYGVVDSVLLAGIFSSQYPDHSIWQKIREVILHPRVSTSQKSGLFEWISRNPEALPSDFTLQEEDRSHLLGREEDWMGEGTRFSALRLLCALNVLPQEDVAEQLMNLATSGSANERVEAARTLPIARYSTPIIWRLTILDMLTRDPSPLVRSHAGAALGAIYRDWDLSDTREIDSIVRRCLESDGVWVPLRTLHGLLREINRKVPIDISEFKESVSLLASNHVDHLIRDAAKRLLRSAGD
ncbi:hypothetical protein [Streptomyces sp. NPDC050704]|uniref:hypothetical protein n=1 Tax=Streptomyces sp. NPDC050704 TaxID=3157219 RepID=UPI003443EE8F